MAAGIRKRRDPDGPDPEESGEWIQVPTVIDLNGDKVVTLVDPQGRPVTRLVAEFILEAFVGPRPPGNVVRFKDGDRLNCQLSNLKWAPSRRPETDRVRAFQTRELADAIRSALEGRRHRDSAELVAEDRSR